MKQNQLPLLPVETDLDPENVAFDFYWLHNKQKTPPDWERSVNPYRLTAFMSFGGQSADCSLSVQTPIGFVSPSRDSFESNGGSVHAWRTSPVAPFTARPSPVWRPDASCCIRGTRQRLVLPQGIASSTSLGSCGSSGN